ncbi:MAG TPA: hypothetical protein VFW22_01245 [Pseudolabrys sp.]|nr:hypothetical protein [Pseudolabrys sp.]
MRAIASDTAIAVSADAWARRGRIIVKAAIIALACGTTLLPFYPLTVQAEPSTAACTDYAHRYAQQQTRGQVLGGAVGGSAVGVGIGALFGKPGAGALIGGGLGTIGGGSRKSQNYKANFEDGFVDCMAGRVQ